MVSFFLCETCSHVLGNFCVCSCILFLYATDHFLCGRALVWLQWVDVLNEVFWGHCYGDFPTQRLIMSACLCIVHAGLKLLVWHTSYCTWGTWDVVSHFLQSLVQKTLSVLVLFLNVVCLNIIAPKLTSVTENTTLVSEINATSWRIHSTTCYSLI